MPLTDVFILLAALCFGGLFLRLGYTAGDRIMDQKYSVTLASGRPLSGAIAEFAILLCATALVLLLDALCNSLTLQFLFFDRWYYAAPIGAVILVLVIFYAVVEVRGTEGTDEERANLRTAYRYYNLYSTIIFALGVLAVVLVAFQYTADRRAILDLGSGALAAFDAAAALPVAASDSALRHMEEGYLLLQKTGLRTSAQLVPALSLVLALLAINFLLAATPLSQVFTATARKATHYLSMLASAGVLIAAAFNFAFTFSDLVGVAAAKMHALHDLAIAQGAADFARYGEMLVDIERSRGVSGFYRVILSDTLAIAVAAVGIAQWAAPFARRKPGA